MKRTAAVLSLLILVGCASFSTNLFRTEQTATDAVYGAYQAYTNALGSGTLHLSQDQSNAVKHARLEFAASVGVLESWRAAYETNSAVKPQAQAALDAVLLNSSNVLYLINLFKQ